MCMLVYFGVSDIMRCRYTPDGEVNAKSFIFFFIFNTTQFFFSVQTIGAAAPFKHFLLLTYVR